MSPRGKLQPVQLVAPAEAVGNYRREAGVAVDARGSATIVWPREVVRPASGRGVEYITPPTVHARSLTANGELGPILDISPNGGYNNRPRIAVGLSGRATVAWQFSDSVSASVHATTIDRNGTVGEVRDLSGGLIA